MVFIVVIILLIVTVQYGGNSFLRFFFLMVQNLGWVARKPVGANPGFKVKRSKQFFVLKYLSLLMVV